MDARDLTRLAATGSVSDGDTRPRITVLGTLPGGLVEARAQGSYASAGVTVEGELLASQPIAVDSKRFIGIAKMLARDKLPVTLEVGEMLSLSNGESHQTLPILDQCEVPCAAVALFPVEVDVGDLKREVRQVGPAVATQMTTPILVGIHLVAGKGWLGMEANNGYSVALQSAIEADGEGDLDVVVGRADLRRALGVITGTRVRIGREGQRLVFSNDTSWVTVSLMGDGSIWPTIKFPPLTEFGQHVQVPARVLAEALAALTVYASPSIVLRPEWGEVILETENTGVGQYQHRLSGRLVSPVSLGSPEVAILARGAQRETVNIHFDGTRGLALLGERRRAHLTLRFQL